MVERSQKNIGRRSAVKGAQDKPFTQSYLYWLGEALKKERCALHAYALMTNNVQLLIYARAGGSRYQTHHRARAALRAVHQHHSRSVDAMLAKDGAFKFR